MGDALQLSQDNSTLIKRLAGPSSGKAGLAKDQTEINRIIAEVSKGSKFYENEKKKDKELTERIKRIAKERDEALQGADMYRAEQAVDKLLAQLEMHRDLSQIIVHVDMDAFYASVELLDDPSLEGKPFGVGRGVLTTASYEARKYGVRSGMAGFVAKKLCPDLIFVPNHFSRYMELSKKIMEIFRRYDPTMQIAGCDEGYLNITSYCENHGVTAEDCVLEMRQSVYKETKLTVSAGIAPNKMLAKICSDKNKPNGQFQLEFDRETIKTFMRDLSIRKVPFVGRVNERLLESIGIKICDDIFTHRATLFLMDKRFGLNFLLGTYLGISSNIVQPPTREERKSIGAERTFSPIGDQDRILQKLSEVSIELENDMEQGGWTGRTITLKYKLDTYQVFTRAKSCDRWISTQEDLFSIGKELLLPELPLKLRLIGLRVTKLKDLRSQSSTSSGIKRFFESVKPDSPSKKRKLDYNLDNEMVDHLVQTADDEMPGFYEHEEGDYAMREDEQDHEDIMELEKQGPSMIRPPVSAPNRPFLGVGMNHEAENNTIKSRKRSASESNLKRQEILNASRPSEVESHTCPICGKLLETDNQGFNSHIDFCLSRGAIQAAQAEASDLSHPVPQKAAYQPRKLKSTSTKLEKYPIFGSK